MLINCEKKSSIYCSWPAGSAHQGVPFNAASRLASVLLRNPGSFRPWPSNRCVIKAAPLILETASCTGDIDFLLEELVKLPKAVPKSFPHLMLRTFCFTDHHSFSLCPQTPSWALTTGCRDALLCFLPSWKATVFCRIHPLLPQMKTLSFLSLSVGCRWLRLGPGTQGLC